MKLLYLTLILFFCSSCTYRMHSFAERNFVGRYDNRPNGADSVLSFDGCYARAIIRCECTQIHLDTVHTPLYSEIITTPDNEHLKCDTLFNFILFYEDGTVLIASYENRLDDIWKKLPIFCSGGMYRVEGDTLFLQKMSYPYVSFTSTWYLYEERYSIVDRNILERLKISHSNHNTSPIERKTSEFDNCYGNQEKIEVVDGCLKIVYRFPYQFYPLDSGVVKPLPDTWFKQKKQYWKNEFEWAEYMRSRFDYTPYISRLTNGFGYYRTYKRKIK